MKKLKTFDSIYYRGKSHFEEDGTQSYLLFIKTSPTLVNYLFGAVSLTKNADINKLIIKGKTF